MLGAVADLLTAVESPRLIARLYTSTPPRLAAAVAAQRFRRTVRWAAARSPFYQRRFAELGINPAKVRTPADLGGFYTTPDDIAREPESFLCDKPAIVFESSGTSGRNKQVFYGQREWERIGATAAAGFHLMGVTPEDRVANAFDFSIWIPGLLCHYGLMAAGVFCQAFGKVDPIEVYRRLRQQRFTVVLGEPTWLIRLTEIAERDGGYPLKLLIGGAEEMPSDAIPWMEKVWGPAKVKMTYSSVEMATSIGFQPCDRREAYHLDHLDFLPEIIEPDESGYGELVFTTLARRTMPLIRYRTRDVTRFVSEPCPCGMRTPRLAKVKGRRDELVVASGGNLYPLMFEQIIRSVPGLTFDWQVVFRLEGVREVMEIHIETEREDGSIEADIHRQATALYPDLMKNLALGIFQMRILPHRPGTVRSARKLKRLVDLRYSGKGTAAPHVVIPSASHGAPARI